MSFPKLIGYTAVVLFGFILLASKFKGKEREPVFESASPVEIELVQESVSPKEPHIEPIAADDLPDADRIYQLFNKGEPKLPIVETIAYKSRPNWQKGRPAWLADYASHFKTSRHFIARSLHGKPDYFQQNLNEGDRFNVFKEDRDFSFHLVADISRCKMWFYYVDGGEKVLLKTYLIGVGRPDTYKASGCLTPVGKYHLGEKIVIYKPKMFGFHNGEKTEMVKVFGSRWIPFDREVEGCSEPARGYGIHGVPWVESGEGKLTPDVSSLGKYESDGCIRLANEDIEEIFAIIITKPTTIEIVQDFHDAKF